MTCHLLLMRLLYHCTIPAMMNSPSHVICSLSIVCTTIVYLPPLVMNVLCLYLCYHNTYEMCFWHCNANRTPHRGASGSVILLKGVLYCEHARSILLYLAALKKANVLVYYDNQQDRFRICDQSQNLLFNCDLDKLKKGVGFATP